MYLNRNKNHSWHQFLRKNSYSMVVIEQCDTVHHPHYSRMVMVLCKANANPVRFRATTAHDRQLKNSYSTRNLFTPFILGYRYEKKHFILQWRSWYVAEKWTQKHPQDVASSYNQYYFVIIRVKLHEHWDAWLKKCPTPSSDFQTGSSHFPSLKFHCSPHSYPCPL